MASNTDLGSIPNVSEGRALTVYLYQALQRLRWAEQGAALHSEVFPSTSIPQEVGDASGISACASTTVGSGQDPEWGAFNSGLFKGLFMVGSVDASFRQLAALTKMFANASHELREIIRPFNADHVLTRLLSRLTSCLQEKAKKEGWTVEEDKVDPEGLVANQHPTLKTLTFTHGSKQKKVVDLRQPLPRLGYTGTTTVARLNQAISTHISRQADVSPCDPMKSVSETERGTGLTEEQFKHARRLQDAAHIMSAFEPVFLDYHLGLVPDIRTVYDLPAVYSSALEILSHKESLTTLTLNHVRETWGRESDRAKSMVESVEDDLKYLFERWGSIKEALTEDYAHGNDRGLGKEWKLSNHIGTRGTSR